MSIQATTFVPVQLLSHDDDPHWKLYRFPVVGGPALATLKPGYVVKFGATRADVAGGVAADDAVLEGIIIDVPDPNNASDTSVAIALTGSFNKTAVKYADGASPLSVAAVARLRDMGIFLDATVPGGAFAP
jgi:hypothetical protein